MVQNSNTLKIIFEICTFNMISKPNFSSFIISANILVYKTEPKVRRVTPGSSRDNINHIPPKVKPKPAKDQPYRRLPITEAEAMELTPKTSLHEPIRAKERVKPKVNYENYNQLDHPSEPDYMNLEALRIKPQELDQFSKAIGFASTQRIMQMYANPRTPWTQGSKNPSSFSPCHGPQASKTMSHADLRTIRQGHTQRSSSTWDIRHTHNYQNQFPLYSNVFQDYAEPVMNHPMNTRPTSYHAHLHYNHHNPPQPPLQHNYYRHHRSQYLQSNDTLY